jgi:hypothetical protein
LIFGLGTFQPPVLTGNLDAKGAELGELLQDRFGQFAFAVNTFGVQGKQGGPESVKKIKGQRTHRRDFDGGKELPSNVGFEEPSEKTGIGGPVASGLGDRHRTLKYIRFTHVQRVLLRTSRQELPVSFLLYHCFLPAVCRQEGYSVPLM